MKIAYFDCFSGISGDMTVGAMIDAGLDADYLRGEISKLPIGEVAIETARVERGTVSAVKFDVKPRGKSPHHRAFGEIESIIAGSDLAEPVKRTSLEIFRRLAEAEAQVHGIEPSQVQFHEVGAIDSIVDIVGASVGFHALGIERAYCSAVKVGRGKVKCQHGYLPVPAPATTLLLKGFRVVQGDEDGEFTTPTGAAILSALCSPEPVPTMRYLAVGHGAGGRENTLLPNVFRLIIGEADISEEADEVWVLETNIDDMPGELFGHLFEKLSAAGALDVYAVPIQMKKNRPAVLLSVIVPEESLARVEEAIFAETTTFGIRKYRAARSKLRREHRTVETEYGAVRVKVGSRGGVVLTISPEYEDCRAAAERHGVALKKVFDSALRAFERESTR